MGLSILSRAITKAKEKNTEAKKEEKCKKERAGGGFCDCVLGNGTKLRGCSTCDLYIYGYSFVCGVLPSVFSGFFVPVRFCPSEIC